MDSQNYFVNFVGYLPDDTERTATDNWVAANDCSSVATIAIDPKMVSISGDLDHFSGVTGTCLRTNDLTADLSVALAEMRKHGG